MQKHLVILLLICVLALSVFVRIYRNDLVPAGFFCDEAAIGYNAFKILTGAKDEYGEFLPFYFRSFGDYRLPIPIYSNIPFIALFGLNEFSVRLTSAVFGVLTVVVVYFLTKELFGNRWTALTASTFLALSPWHIQFSRFGSEYIYFPFWFTLGLYLYLKGIRKKSKLFYISLPFFGTGLYTYYPALFTIPLFVALLLLIYLLNGQINRQKTIFASILFLLTLIPFILGIVNGAVLTRWNSVEVFQNNSTAEVLPRIIQTYFDHFSLTFLFTHGDIDFPGHFINRFSVRGLGELYNFQLPLLLLGILAIIKVWQFRMPGLIIIIWLLLYPLGSTVTGTDGGGPFAFRSIFGVIPFQILSAVGFVYLLWLIRIRLARYLLLGLISLFIFLSFSNYAKLYFTEYNLYSSDFWGWQYGPKEIMEYFLQVKDSYNDLYLSDEFNAPGIFLKFYDPKNLCQGKCQVGDLTDYNPNRRQLFALSPAKLKNSPLASQFLIKKMVIYPNNQPAFLIGEISGQKEALGLR